MQQVVKELAEAIGLPAAMEVVRRWGGRSLRVPVAVEAGDPLALVLGLDAARALVAIHGGAELQLPVERNALLDMRNEAILRAVEAGESHESVAIQYGMTRQGVGYIVKRMRQQ